MRVILMCPTRDRANYEARAAIIKALACPARLMIVDELAEYGERSVQQLAAMTGSDISTVSRHLSTLKAAGIVASRKCGANVYYRLRVGCIPGFLQCVESMLRENLETSAQA
jgi:DNA-binding transcriptional ArsR family regulator